MSKQSSTTALNTQIPLPQSKPSVLFQLITSLFAFGLSVAWIVFSKQNLSGVFRDQLFTKNPLKNFQDSINLLADLGLYSAIYMVSLTLSVMLMRIANHSLNPAVMKKLQPAQKTNQLIRNFTHSLIIFACLFLYQLENSTKSQRVQMGFILPVWFMSGYAVLWVSNWFELILKRDIGFGKLGQLIVLWTFAILLAQIFGIRLLSRF